MKRLLIILLAVCILLSVAACSNDGIQDTTDPTQTTMVPTTGETAPTQQKTEPTQSGTQPTEEPQAPTEGPEAPTEAVTEPTQAPTAAPTEEQTAPTQPGTVPAEAATEPTKMTAAPTVPTQSPTTPKQTTPLATNAPTQAPTVKPTAAPTQKPTQAPTTAGHTHSYTAKITAATCTQGGYTTHTCACGHSYTDSQTPAKGHGTTRTETKEATTSAAGYTRVICNDCSKILSETEIPQLENEHTCSMKRINCEDLKDNALGWYTANYQTYYQCSILACEECGQADPTSLEFIYTPEQATAKIVEMINAERYRVYGTHDYDVVVATHHSASAWAAEYLATDYQHCTPFWDNIAHRGLNNNIISGFFEQCMNSPAHYDLIIDKDAKYVSLGTYVNSETGAYLCLIMWTKDELYLDNPNYTWWAR